MRSCFSRWASRRLIGLLVPLLGLAACAGPNSASSVGGANGKAPTIPTGVVTWEMSFASPVSGVSSSYRLTMPAGVYGRESTATRPGMGIEVRPTAQDVILEFRISQGYHGVGSYQIPADPQNPQWNEETGGNESFQVGNVQRIERIPAAQGHGWAAGGQNSGCPWLDGSAQSAEFSPCVWWKPGVNSSCTVTVTSVGPVVESWGETLHVAGGIHEVKGTFACQALQPIQQGDPEIGVQNGTFDVLAT